MYCRGKNIIIDTSRYEAANDRLISLFNGVSDILNIDRIATWVERLPGDPAAYKQRWQLILKTRSLSMITSKGNKKRLYTGLVHR